MLDQLAKAWKLGREWGERHADPFPRNYQVEEELSRAGLPDEDADHFRAFRDGARDGAGLLHGKEG